MTMKKRTVLLIGMVLFVIVLILYRLETWTPHEENPLMLLLMAALMLVSVALGVLAAAACLWGALIYWRIPFCLECNGGVTPEELGWMVLWFYP